MFNVTLKNTSTQAQLTRHLYTRWNGLMQHHRKRGDVLSDPWLEFDVFNDQVRKLYGFSSNILLYDHTMFRVSGHEPFSSENTLFIEGRVPAASTREYLTVGYCGCRVEDLIINKRRAANGLCISPVTMKNHANSNTPFAGMNFKWVECTPEYMYRKIKQGCAYV